jgi:carbon-monoxide dehydrogenase medium subunit
MKPAAFEYHAPKSLAELLSLLRAHGADGKLLAGGQSLVPAMNFRLARPAHLFDMNGIPGLDVIAVAQDKLSIGALVRHARFHQPVTDAPIGRILADIVRHIAHYPIRQRGTFVGSLAHADPASEWCLVAATFDAEIVAKSESGTRELKGKDYFRGTFATELRSDEVITEVRLPLFSEAWRLGFYEFSRRAGDFALSMSLVTYKLKENKIIEARVGVGGVADRPIRLPAAEQCLVGQIPGPKIFAEAADAARDSVDPMEDIHASAAYRRDLVRATTRRALERARST